MLRNDVPKQARLPLIVAVHYFVVIFELLGIIT